MTSKNFLKKGTVSEFCQFYLFASHDGFISANTAQLGLNPLLAAYSSDILVS